MLTSFTALILVLAIPGDGSQASVDLLDAPRAIAPSNPQSGPGTTEDGIVGWIGGWFE
eukprot:m.47214 g.47214  ORF g.47214 m.47214 type:complete len:58 (+) comp8831_c0_seq1:3827-4000(+)